MSSFKNLTEQHLYESLLKGDIRALKDLLDRDVSPNIRFNGNKAAIHYAAQNDHLECLKLLISRGAKIDIPDAENETPLHKAIWYGCIKSAEYLISQGANIHLKDYRQCSTVFFAAENGQYECLMMLVKKGARLHELNNSAMNILHYIALEGVRDGDTEIVKYLLEKGVDPLAKNNIGNTPYSLAESIAKESDDYSVFSIIDEFVKTKQEHDALTSSIQNSGALEQVIF